MLSLPRPAASLPREIVSLHGSIARLKCARRVSPETSWLAAARSDSQMSAALSLAHPIESLLAAPALLHGRSIHGRSSRLETQVFRFGDKRPRVAPVDPRVLP